MKLHPTSHFSLGVEQTDDGSVTLFVKELDEHYHSVKGALTESEHVYRDVAYLHRLAASNVPLRLLEIGFGTGLNALVTALEAEKHEGHLTYITLEKYPLNSQMVQMLDYGRLAHEELWTSIHEAPWEQPVVISSHFTLEKRQADLLTTDLPSHIDIVYFDAFAPEKQPELWTEEIFARLFAAMRPGGVLSTYCAKGVIRRMLVGAGFQVERLPGPPGGKREILRATKPLS